jgi:hypothetical protein
MQAPEPCQDCRQHLHVNAVNRPHSRLSLIRAKTFRGVMADRHDEYIYRCGTCATILCRLNHGDGRVIFWYVMRDLPHWVGDNSNAT